MAGWPQKASGKDPRADTEGQISGTLLQFRGTLDSTEPRKGHRLFSFLFSILLKQDTMILFPQVSKILSCYHQILSGSHKLVFGSHKLVFGSHKLVS